LIARIWRGVVRTGDAAAYARYIEDTGLGEYKQTPGNRGAWLLRKTDGGRTEFLTVSFWESRQAIEGFAGQDIDKAVYYPEDERFLIEHDLTVRHYDIIGEHEAP
jgi:heme-degrading monooxygenase HmoA